MTDDVKTGPDGKEWATTLEGYAHVDTMVERASAIDGSGAPLWHGWALRDAFVAGAEWQEGRTSTPDGRLQILADSIKRMGLEIFDRPECPQEVRDAIEWFAAELSVSKLPEAP